MSVIDHVYPPASPAWKPERRFEETTLEEFLKRLLSYGRPLKHTTKRLYWQRFLAAARRASAACADLDDAQVIEQIRTRLYPAASARPSRDTLPWLFGVVAELAHRHLGMRPFEVQLIGARCLLDGKVVEMDTGEGKTLTAAIAASCAALHGVDVHVITVNDYLAERDAEFGRPLYAALGLDVGAIVHGLDDGQRQAAYGRAITYCTNKEIAFDYLRDRIRGRGTRTGLPRVAQSLFGDAVGSALQVQRGLSFGIVDEADSVLIDEARSPLIIAGQEENFIEKAYLEQALEVGRELLRDVDFKLDEIEREVRINDTGRRHIAELSAEYGPLWKARRRSEEMVKNALTALHLYQLDNHYIVDEDKVQIVDEHTGRVLDGRRWERGIHQMIELKEGVKTTAQTATIDRISYQDYFRRYLSLSGMTGTGREVARELFQVYGLTVVRVPTNRPARRQRAPTRVLRTREQKHAAICAEVARLHAAGKPVLVGTRTVEDSELISQRLTAEGLQHSVLNAKNHREEAEIIARAGEAGQITVATNMAGRGTDIKITPEVAALGGLHVIVSEMHESRRIDRQLIGRCGRQGDPGHYQVIVSLEDGLFTTQARGPGRLLLWFGLATRLGLPTFLLYARLLQRRLDRRNASIRRRLLRQERNTRKLLFFAGTRD
ncbi:MAG TPA: helicase-related protein [Gammaproteobacteria bacterium]